jgi:hypothetical protein
MSRSANNVISIGNLYFTDESLEGTLIYTTGDLTASW